MLDSTTVVSVRMTFVLTASSATPYWPSSSLTRFQVSGRIARKHLSRKSEVHHRPSSASAGSLAGTGRCRCGSRPRGRAALPGAARSVPAGCSPRCSRPPGPWQSPSESFRRSLMDRRKDLGIVVEDLTDGPVSGTIVANDLGQPVIAGLETQHGFPLPTHPCSPSWSL